MPRVERELRSGSWGWLDALAIVVGMYIGGGIFLVPNLVARNLAEPASILAVWIFAGVVSFFGALACAELGAAMPATGGQYVFLREMYGPMAGFLCGWTMFLVGQDGAGFLAGGDARALRVLFRSAEALAGEAAWRRSDCDVRGNQLPRGFDGSAGAESFTSAKLIGLLIIIGSACLYRGAGRRRRRRVPFHIRSFRNRADRLPAGVRRMGAGERTWRGRSRIRSGTFYWRWREEWRS